MTTDLSLFRTGIEDELSRLEAMLLGITDSSSIVELDQSSVGRLSRMDALQQQAMSNGIRGRLLLRKRSLEAALTRIGVGSFGLCCQCDAEIAPERLTHDFAAIFCFECMSERDTSKQHF